MIHQVLREAVSELSTDPGAADLPSALTLRLNKFRAKVHQNRLALQLLMLKLTCWKKALSFHTVTDSQPVLVSQQLQNRLSAGKLVPGLKSVKKVPRSSLHKHWFVSWSLWAFDGVFLFTMTTDSVHGRACAGLTQICFITAKLSGLWHTTAQSRYKGWWSGLKQRDESWITRF